MLGQPLQFHHGHTLSLRLPDSNQLIDRFTEFCDATHDTYAISGITQRKILTEINQLSEDLHIGTFTDQRIECHGIEGNQSKIRSRKKLRHGPLLRRARGYRNPVPEVGTGLAAPAQEHPAEATSVDDSTFEEACDVSHDELLFARGCPHREAVWLRRSMRTGL